MVHRHIGSARITYPTGVKVSPVDPMTSANLPRELRMVPGVVSRPVRIGAGARGVSPTATQLIQQYMAKAGGDPLQAVAMAKTDRAADPHNIALRNAEHALFSRYVIAQLGPVVGRAVVATSVPAYSLAKALGRRAGFFQAATPPSWEEVQYGLQPIVAPAPAPTPAPAPVRPVSYVTVGVWPGAMVATVEQCQAYLATHGATGGCQAVYNDTGLPAGSLIPYAAPAPAGGLAGVGYYPNLGQDAGAAASFLPASVSSVPTWVWWVGGGALLALLVGGVFAGGRARRIPRVRTVTRTTY